DVSQCDLGVAAGESGFGGPRLQVVVREWPVSLLDEVAAEIDPDESAASRHEHGWFGGVVEGGHGSRRVRRAPLRGAEPRPEGLDQRRQLGGARGRAVDRIDRNDELTEVLVTGDELEAIEPVERPNVPARR